MRDDRIGDMPQQIGFYLAPRFSMMSFASAIEPLRTANELSGRQIYECRIISHDGEPVRSANDMLLVADGSISETEYIHTMVVCAGYQPHLAVDDDVLAWLRRLDRRGSYFGAVDTGSYILAKAGLLDGYRATLHWKNLEAFVEQFPKVTASNRLFEIDRNRFTCGGATAGLDMMLYLIGVRLGQRFAAEVSDHFIHHRIRDPNEHQRMALQARLGISHPKLLRVIAAMEANVEDPIRPISLAEMMGVTVRQLERLFRRYVDSTPTRYYADLRLRRARSLLMQTDMSVHEVIAACGFGTHSHFSRAYRTLFGRSPIEDRAQGAAAES
jgi:AraC family transcriptional regulator, glycine betaine-responsive activator